VDAGVCGGEEGGLENRGGCERRVQEEMGGLVRWGGGTKSRFLVGGTVSDEKKKFGGGVDKKRRMYWGSSWGVHQGGRLGFTNEGLSFMKGVGREDS